jgi:hypothetical protein
MLLLVDVEPFAPLLLTQTRRYRVYGTDLIQMQAYLDEVSTTCVAGGSTIAIMRDCDR